MSAVAVQPSSDQQSGLGLFATSGISQHIKHSWLGRRLGALVLRGAANQTVTVASIPLQLGITVESAVTHPQLGHQFAELLELGLLDERTAVVLMLLVERARGADSPRAPWLQLLPDRFNTPLFYSDAQLQELAGTTLAAANAARQAALDRSWQQLKPAVQQMFQLVGIAGEPSFADFLWATSIFWSRGMAMSVAYTDAQEQQQQQQPAGSNGGSSNSSSGSSGGMVHIKVLEGVVPGLDFANHSQQPKCWWEVDAADNDQQQQQQQQPGVPSSSHVVKLMANRACCPSAGEELSISYGDKGNEELLLLYGFAVPQNPHETLMVLCPLPAPEDWDQTFTARMHLLQARGLRPQLFLSASHYQSATGQPLLLAPVAPAPESRDTNSSAPAAPAGTTPSSSNKALPRRLSVVPEAARQVLEVFVLDKQELAAALERQAGEGPEQATAAASAGGSSDVTDPVQQRMQQLGLNMAVLTTFARLLELKMIGMEGEEGTGALEADLQQLAALDEADKAAGAGQAAWRRHCLVYRAGQKALVRSYITAARAELQETLAELQALMAEE